jgi:hypothetical protein
MAHTAWIDKFPKQRNRRTKWVKWPCLL